MSFSELGLIPEILQAVTDAGYTTPTPIQHQAIPVVLAGHDVMGGAQTGTGKTAGFTLPLLNRLARHASTSTSPARHPVRALILAPTRELATQIHESHVILEKTTRLTSTGYGDLIEKIPAGADWILADELGVERIDAHVWDLVQGRLRNALAPIRDDYDFIFIEGSIQCCFPI